MTGVTSASKRVLVGSHVTQFSTALDALRDDEIASTRLFLQIGWLVAAVAIVCVLRLPGDPDLARAVLLSIGATTALSIAAYLTLHTALRPALIFVLALACVACTTIANVYVGYFSAAPCVIVLGVYFFSRIANRAPAIAIYSATCLAHLIASSLIIAGKLPDPAYAPMPPGVPLQAIVVGLFGVQLAYAIAFWLARSTRAASLRAIEELQRATRIAAVRLAQVDEVRDDLDRALRVGGPGRFTNAVIANWELGNVIGRGGMGEVYDATHVESGAKSALKLLRRELMVDHQHVERFLREVRVAGALDTPHVVKVLDASKPDDVVAFLAMERLDGQTLGAIARGGAPIDPAMILEMVREVGTVLDLARAAGIVHRDLKPSNIYRTDTGVWKLLDFGVAALGDTTGTLTEGAVVGTPGYMAPEQAAGEHVDHRADLYALAAVIYRCVTGRIPFAGSELAAVLYAMVQYMPLRPSGLAQVSDDVERFLAIGLAKSPAARFQTGVELASALAAAFEGELPSALRDKAHALLRELPWRELETEVTRELTKR